MDLQQAQDEPRAYRVTFFKTHDSEPWACVFCEEDVFTDELHVHHMNGNHNDNRSDNLVAAHEACHAAHHARLRAESELQTTGPFTCDWCGREFARLGGLSVHISHAHRAAGRHRRKEKNNEDHVHRICEICNRECSGLRSYVTHKRMSHGPGSDERTARNGEIYTRWLVGESTQDLATAFGLSASAVKVIVWRHKKEAMDA